MPGVSEVAMPVLEARKLSAGCRSCATSICTWRPARSSATPPGWPARSEPTASARAAVPWAVVKSTAAPSLAAPPAQDVLRPYGAPPACPPVP